VKPNSSLLMVGTVALVPPTLSFAIFLAIVPYSVASLEAISSGSDPFQFLLSVDQQKKLQKLHAEMKPQVLAILHPNQQAQLETTLTQGQNLWEGLAILNLSEIQKSRVQGIMKSQRLKIFKLLTPDQRRQLGRSLPAQLLQ
jgi:hypothetical protein